MEYLRLQLLLFSLLSFLLSFFFLKMFTWKKPPSRSLPPGPPKLPIIGNLHQFLGVLPHVSLRRLSDKYGPIIHLRLGSISAVVVASAELAEDVLRTHDLRFCDRPPMAMIKRFTYGRLDMAGASYDERLKQTRKLCTAELFSARKVEWSRPIREEEVDTLASDITRLSSKGPVNLSEMLISLFSNITRRQVSGRRVSQEGECRGGPLSDLLLELNSLAGELAASDFFPNMPWLDVLNGRHARQETCFLEVDRFLEEEMDTLQIVETGTESTASTGEDDNFIRTMLRLQKDPAHGGPFSTDKIKAILVDMFVGGSESSMSSLEWSMSELVLNPRVMKKAQEEVRRVAGVKPKLDEDDLKQLHYIKLVLKETWRLHPPGPLLVPRCCREDCKLAGYAVAAKTWVFVNVWAIGRDPKYWREPEVFRPERFEDSSVDYKGQHFVLLPFGSGRRICPGMALGVAGVELALANLLLRFNWELPDGVRKHGLNMGEAVGISNHRSSPLILKATLATDMP